MARRFREWPYWLPVLRALRSYASALPLFGISRRR